MADPLVSPTHEIIQFRGETYRIPFSDNIFEHLGVEIISDRVKELAKERNLDITAKKGDDCGPFCGHSAIVDRSKICTYRPSDDNDPQYLSYFEKKGSFKKIKFAARMKPCVGLTSLCIALIENGIMDEYKVGADGIDAKEFPYIMDIENNPRLEASAIKMYKNVFIGGKKP